MKDRNTEIREAIEAGNRALELLGDEGVVSTASLEDLAVLADLLTHRVS